GVRERRVVPQPPAARHRATSPGHASDRSPAPEVVYEDSDYAREQAELAIFAARDNQPDERHNRPKEQHPDTRPGASRPVPTRRRWWRAPELPAEIRRFAGEPWVALQLAGDELVRVRHGGTVVVMGGSGSASRPSSLACWSSTRHTSGRRSRSA